MRGWIRRDPDGLGDRLAGLFPAAPIGLQSFAPKGQRLWIAGAAGDRYGAWVGVAQLEADDDDPGDAWAYVAIDPARRGRGLGRLLLAALAAEARPLGFTRLLAAAAVEWADPAALRCATAAGFVPGTAAQMGVPGDGRLALMIPSHHDSGRAGPTVQG
ncbi:MAG TPA: GNAT family N-acetyltransferase [Geminicoccaceae bacterium]|nr:GNAT family N-acetyltransferase [Geminicoccaceae bacterium]